MTSSKCKVNHRRWRNRRIGALHFKVNFNTGNEKNNNCVRQEEPTILIFRLLLRIRRMYVASIPLEFH